MKDVTTHPAFRNAAASVAQLYDALHKPEMQLSVLEHRHRQRRLYP
ncbi:hypothetical protein ACVXHA_02970 [Escherichia coli]